MTGRVVNAAVTPGSMRCAARAGDDDAHAASGRAAGVLLQILGA